MNPTYDFSGQVAFVTGAGAGMGLATARAFAASGAAVALTDIDEAALNAAARNSPTPVTRPSPSRVTSATRTRSPPRSTGP